jgi:hypothetical protein
MKINLQSLLITGILISSVNNLVGQCTLPSSVIATPSVICSGASTTLNATSIGSSIKWYTVATSGVATGTSASSANFPITPVNTTTYYAEAFVNSTPGASLAINYTGSMQQVIIPTGVTQVTIVAAGAQGGSNAQGVTGGFGGSASGILTVTPGDVLNVYVGGTNGYNGGGVASNTACITCGAGNGGGASDVRLNGVALANRIIVAAGGGGAGGNRVNGLGRGAGGGGGAGYYGGGGGAAWPSSSTTLALGGDQTAGGAPGISTYASAPGNNGTAGALGVGGNGGAEVVSNQGGSQTAIQGAAGGGTLGATGTYAGNFTGQSGAGGSSYITGLISGTTTSGTQTGNGQIVIYGISGLGCVSASRTPVLVAVNASPTLAISGSTSVCAGGTVNLTASGATTYTWNTTATTASISVTPTTNTTYTALGTSSVTGCVGSAIKSVSVNPLPSVSASSTSSLICAGQTVSLTASGASTYSWNTSATTSVVAVSPSVTTSYTVTGTNTNSCSASVVITQSVSACTGLNNNVASTIGTVVYPNPNTGLFIIELNNGSVKTIEVMDLTGRVVLLNTSSNDKMDFNISNLSNGIYYVRVQSNNAVEVIKIVKQ